MESTSESSSLPAWVRKRDGRLEPFEAEKINRALFACTETIGVPDPFLARELTDSILYFLPRELEGSTVSSSEIGELLVKVVRELGHPELSQAYSVHQHEVHSGVVSPPEGSAGTLFDKILHERGSPTRLVRILGLDTLNRVVGDRIYARNLVAAHQEKLITLLGLEAPRELSAAVVRPQFSVPRGSSTRAQGVFEQLEQARGFLGGTAAIDGPEYELAQAGARISETAAYIREIQLAARSLGINVVLNLGCATPPSWAEEVPTGPLFASVSPAETRLRLESYREAIVDFLFAGECQNVRVDWHYTLADFEDEGRLNEVRTLARRALAGKPIAFVCDRPRRPIALAENLTRAAPALLQTISLHLNSIHDRRPLTNLEELIPRTCRLIRLALSAGQQKRDFIRQFGFGDRPGFLLDQAFLGLRMHGLDAILATHFGTPLAGSEPALAFAHRFLRELMVMAQREGPQSNLLCSIEENDLANSLVQQGTEPRTLLRLVGRVHALLDRGTLAIPFECIENIEGLLELLQYTYRQTAICRLCVAHEARRAEQMIANWGAEAE